MSGRFNSKVIFTISFLLALLGLVVLQNKGLRVPSWRRWSAFQSKTETSPEEAIYTMLDAARAGNTGAYLDSFAGPMHDQLLEMVDENTEPKFAAYLTTQNAAFQGVAIAVINRPSETEACARLEYIYSNRNEIQNVFLKNERGKWRILKVAGAEQIKTLVPFGTATTD
jgi:hypothetical protein